MSATIAPPASDEYNPYYAGYVGRVPDGDILAILAAQPAVLDGLLRDLSDAEARSRFAPGEWTIKEVVGHLIDAERLFAHRALTIARADPAPLPGFDQDAYVAAADYDARPLADLLDELGHLRQANLLAFRHLPAGASERRGTASEWPVSVRALLHILAGHLTYHLEDLREKYLPALGR